MTSGNWKILTASRQEQGGDLYLINGNMTLKLRMRVFCQCIYRKGGRIPDEEVLELEEGSDKSGERTGATGKTLFLNGTIAEEELV